MNQIFFTSDLHIGHDKEFIWKNRGFTSIEDHDTAILKNWNDTIMSGDTVYILGDLCLGQNEKEWNRVYKNLNGDKYFIRGNHDTNNKISKYVEEYNIKDLGYANIIKYNKKWSFYLCHYPTFTENPYEPHKNPVINLFGHTHQNSNFFINNYYMYHVGLDSHNLTPVSIEQIIEDISKERKKE